MSSKTIILVVIFSLLVGGAIFFITGDRGSNIKRVISQSQNLKNSQTNQSPTPKPKITFPPLTQDSNLEEELEKITPSDFSEDIQQLKER